MEIRYARQSDTEGINVIGNHYIQESPANFKADPLNLAEREQWMAGFHETGRYRLLIAVDNEKVCGYACSAIFHERSAYETSVSTSIYLHPETCSRGLGTQLYTRLFEVLKGEDIKRAFAGITLPNPASVGIHKKFGFTEVGVFTKAGRKFGKYWDVLWLEKAM